MLAAGTPPDLFYLPPDIFPELATQKLIRPIDDYVAREYQNIKQWWDREFLA